MKHFILTAIAALLIAAPAAAQQPPSSPAPPPPGTYMDTDCGSWVNDEWVDNGHCTQYVTVIRHESLTGTITSVKGHLVTLQQATRTVTINDQPALDRQQTGKVAVGRQVVAYGYWRGGNFFATAIY